MNSKSISVFKTIGLIFSLVFAVSANSFNSKFVSDDKDTKSTRPRISASNSENPDSKETATKKAVVSFDLERRVFDLINKQRAANGLQPLVWNDDVAKAARLHSENMANLKFFSHQGLDGLMVNDRAATFGIKTWRSIGENIASNQGYNNPAEFAVECWMKSPGHRANILNDSYKESAIGVAVTADNKYYFTEVFVLRK